MTTEGYACQGVGSKCRKCARRKPVRAPWKLSTYWQHEGEFDSLEAGLAWIQANVPRVYLNGFRFERDDSVQIGTNAAWAALHRVAA